VKHHPEQIGLYDTTVDIREYRREY